MRRQLLAFASLAALAACQPGKAEPTDSFADLDGADEKSDSFSYRMKLIGSLDYGQTSDPVKYTSSPRYRAFKFGGAKGDKVDIWVRSSNGGDAVTWLVDNNYNVIASNDDASSSTLDSHITATLPANKTPSIITYMIIFRDYSLSSATFTVALKGPAKDFYSCKKDADCAVTPRVCCTNLGNTAVTKGQEAAYKASLNCPSPLICPLIATRDDHGVAECNTGSGKCEYVLPANISCGGHTINPHACPTGYVCGGDQMAYDAPGSCFQTCGGIAARPCDDLSLACVDNPWDSCDPSAGGADCGGICKACIQNVACMVGYQFDSTQCKCVERTTCGGIAGFSCAAGKTCIDDPSDSCDPAHGGADCGGICVASTDCRAAGCSGTNQCVFCWGSYACIPKGAVC